MRRRGQAALEFLTTYGWAFLVILVMIGALAYFGVLNPRGLLPARCQFGPEVGCIEHQITAADQLRFRFRNDVGSSSYFFINVTYTGGTNPEVTCTTSPNTLTNPLSPGGLAEATCDFDGTAGGSFNFAAGDAAKFSVEILHQKTDGRYNQTTAGDIYGTVSE
jgi:hypothetical protein